MTPITPLQGLCVMLQNGIYTFQVFADAQAVVFIGDTLLQPGQSKYFVLVHMDTVQLPPHHGKLMKCWTC